MQTFFLNYQCWFFSFVWPLALFASEVDTLHGAEDLLAVELRDTAVQMDRSADLLKNEIKANFKGTRKYGKLLSVVAKIKSRSAAWVRRVDRDSDYQMRTRDIEKIKKLAYELSTEYDSAIEYSNVGKGGPILGPTVLTAEQISVLISLTERIQFVSYKPVVLESRMEAEQTVTPKLILVPPYDPALDVAPGRPDVEPNVTVRRQSTAPLVVEPGLEKMEEPALKSVWEK
ncbi:MAG: hypothetical protein ACKVHR_08425 [Pirellulales bacterium]|jgi:hypothetical protein